jgi:pantothenate synthetase
VPRTAIQIATKLFEHARHTVEEKNHCLSESAAHDLQKMCTVAAENIVRMHEAMPQSSENALLRMATIIVAEIVGEMIEASAEHNDSGNQLGQNTLVRAKKVLGPVWPFC